MSVSSNSHGTESQKATFPPRALTVCWGSRLYLEPGMECLITKISKNSFDTRSSSLKQSTAACSCCWSCWPDLESWPCYLCQSCIWFEYYAISWVHEGCMPWHPCASPSWIITMSFSALFSFSALCMCICCVCYSYKDIVGEIDIRSVWIAVRTIPALNPTCCWQECNWISVFYIFDLHACILSTADFLIITEVQCEPCLFSWCW